MYNIKNNYFHKTKLKIKCECCTNEFIDIKELFTKEKMSKKNIEEYYDNYYTSKKMEICNKCHSDMFPEEYINIKSYTIKDYNSDLDVYIDNENKIIPTNDMKLVGITLEGTNENNKSEAIILSLNEDNFRKIYLRGKSLWDNGYVSKYITVFLHNNKCFMTSRPDKWNFEKYNNLNTYMTTKNGLFRVDALNNHFLYGKDFDYIKNFYKVEEIKTEIPIERGKEIEM